MAIVIGGERNEGLISIQCIYFACTLLTITLFLLLPDDINNKALLFKRQEEEEILFLEIKERHDLKQVEDRTRDIFSNQ